MTWGRSCEEVRTRTRRRVSGRRGQVSLGGGSLGTQARVAGGWGVAASWRTSARRVGQCKEPETRTSLVCWRNEKKGPSGRKSG